MNRDEAEAYLKTPEAKAAFERAQEQQRVKVTLDLSDLYVVLVWARKGLTVEDNPGGLETVQRVEDLMNDQAREHMARVDAESRTERGSP